MNTEKIRFQGLQRVYDVPSWSRFVPKGTAPKGAPTLIFPTLTTNPNRVVVELFEHQGWTGSSNCWTGFNNSLDYELANPPEIGQLDLVNCPIRQSTGLRFSSYPGLTVFPWSCPTPNWPSFIWKFPALHHNCTIRHAMVQHTTTTLHLSSQSLV